MLELPEVITLQKQLKETVLGKEIVSCIANFSPHKFTFYSDDPSNYGKILNKKVITEIKEYGFYIVIELSDNIELLFRDGVNLRYHKNKSTLPSKHQLLLEFSDNTYLSASVSMYGGIWCSKEKEFDNNQYLKIAKESVLPISKEFDYEYFNNLFNHCKPSLSSKAFLATEQRIIGIGNGVVQDILFHAKIHPKRKIDTLNERDKKLLFEALKNTLYKMIEDNSRDTEKDLYGNQGNYKTLLSKNTVGKKCQVCNTIIKKENYLGGSIYYCEICQKQ